jgi:molybdopterin-guanine dinucleotide biosynthesis protein A
MAQLPKEADGTVAQLPFRSARWEPLCGFYRRDCLPSLRAYLESGQRSLQGWLAQQPVRALAVGEPQALWNCNAPADLAARGA